jgi:hypothetical protein
MMNRQHGFAIISYVLAAAGMLAVMSAMLLLSSNRSSTADQQWSMAAQITAQGNLLRQRVLDCAGQGGDNGTVNHPSYPQGSNTVVTALTCPYTGQSLLSGTDGIFLPPPPSGFNAWTYTNNASTVQLRLQATDSASAAGYAAALNSAVAKFGVVAAIVTATSANDTFQLTVSN